MIFDAVAVDIISILSSTIPTIKWFQNKKRIKEELAQILYDSLHSINKIKGWSDNDQIGNLDEAFFCNDIIKSIIAELINPFNTTQTNLSLLMQTYNDIWKPENRKWQNNDFDLFIMEVYRNISSNQLLVKTSVSDKTYDLNYMEPLRQIDIQILRIYIMDRLKKRAVNMLQNELEGSEYIIPSLFKRKKYYTTQQEEFYGSELIDNIDDFLSKKEKYSAIIADSGFGKTVFLKYLFYYLVNNKTKSNLIPIYFPPSVTSALLSKKTLIELICDHFNDIPTGYDKFHLFLLNELNNNEFIFFIDGYDQMANTVLFDQNYKNIFSDNLIILSSRSDKWTQSDELSKKFTAFDLNCFDIKQISAYFKNQKNISTLTLYTNQLREDIIKIPLFLKMIKETIKDYDCISFDTRLKVYEKYIDYVVKREKKINTFKFNTNQSGYFEVISQISELAYLSIMNNYLGQIPRQYIKKIVKCNINDVIIEGITYETEKEIIFQHRTFQEFLSARYISIYENKIDRIIKEKQISNWRNVILFLVEIKGVMIIKKLLLNNDKKNTRLFLAAEALQYLNKIDYNILREVNTRIIKLIPHCKNYYEIIDILDANRYLKNPTILKTFLSHDDYWVRRRTVGELEQLYEILDREIINKSIDIILYDLLVDSEDINILQSIKNKIDQDHIKYIYEKFLNPNYLEREIALKMLIILKDKVCNKIINKIVTQFSSTEYYLRAAAVQAYIALIPALNNKTRNMINKMMSDNETRELAIRSLHNFAIKLDNQMINTIAKYLKDDDVNIQRASFETLINIHSSLNDKVIRRIVLFLKTSHKFYCESIFDALQIFKDKIKQKDYKFIEKKYYKNFYKYY